MSRTDDPTAEVTDLLQLLIRNQCVNDGTIASGEETRSVDLLAGYLAGAGDHEIFEPQPGRQSLVARIEGTDPDAPALLLMGHTDVVPVNPDGWSRDPFGAELVDGFVWGRGAVDMLNLTASQAVAFRRLADSGFRPRGTLIFLAVADEEALGTWGADWLLQHERDAVYADYVLTEAGGFQIPTPAGPRLPVVVGEKGTFWTKIKVHGTPGHGSQPFRTDNALVTAAEVVRRIADFRPQTQIHESWHQFVEGLHYEPELTEALLSADGFADALAELPVGVARHWHACTHTTFAPTVAHGGTKTNVIPDLVELEVDIRTLPGQIGSGSDRAAARGARRPGRRGRHRVQRRPGHVVADRHAAVGLPVAHERRALRGLRAGAVAHGGRHRQPLLPSRRRGGLRLRPVLAAPALRGLRGDVPRQRREGRPGVVGAVDAAVGSRRPRPHRLR